VVRHKMMRLLQPFRSYRHHQHDYYDVWETLKKAKEEGWSVPNPVGLTPDERAMEAVEKDFAYLRGWYCDDWHWCGICITVMEDGEKTSWDSSLWGLESDDIDHHEEVISELLADALARRAEAARKLLHENQLELSL